MDEVIAQIENGITVDGEQKRAKFTFVNLPQVDSVGHAMGRGPFYDQHVGMADAEIERLADALKASWRMGALGDHRHLRPLDGHDADEDLADGAIEGAGVSERRVHGGSERQRRLRLPGQPQGAARRARRAARNDARGDPAARRALTRRSIASETASDGDKKNTIRKVHPDWSAGKRTGDIVATSDVGVAFSEPDLSGNPLTGNHGAPQTEDNFMSVVGGWPKIKTGTVDGDSQARAHPQQRHRLDRHAPFRPQGAEEQRRIADQGSVQEWHAQQAAR